MKKLLVMAFALILGSVVYAQSGNENALCLKTKLTSNAYCAHNQDVCTKCPVCEHGSLVYCEDLPANSPRACCFRNKPTGTTGGAKDGFPQSVCEKLTYPQIVHRPRCEESKHCKIYPHLRHCEDLYGNETHGKLVACCWVGPQPNEGGRGGKGGKNGKVEPKAPKSAPKAAPKTKADKVKSADTKKAK